MNLHLVIFALLAPFLTLHAADAAKPNVVYLMADDLGWGDISAHPGGSIPTPNIDKLFKQGVELRNFMSWCVCSPTRAMLLTGWHPFRVGTGLETGGELEKAETTIAEGFKANGYRKFNPYGFALENFDAIGGWRANYSKDQKIDPTGALPTGEKFTGVTDFRSLLIARHEQFTRALTEKLLTYALGCGPEFTDQPAIEGVMKNLSANKGGFKDLVRAVVLSEPFAKN